MTVRDDSVREQITQVGGTTLRVAIRPGTGTGPLLLLCKGGETVRQIGQLRAAGAEHVQTGPHPEDQGPRQAADGTAAAQATAEADALAEALQAARAAQQAAETAAAQAAAALRDAREQAAAAPEQAAATEEASALCAGEGLADAQVHATLAAAAAPRHHPAKPRIRGPIDRGHTQTPAYAASKTTPTLTITRSPRLQRLR